MLNGVITAFQTPGPYTVTRTAASTLLNGREVPGATSTFTIVACVQPMSGRMLEALPEGRRTTENRVIYTETLLVAMTPTNAPDVVTIDSEAWEVFQVQRWQHWGATHFVAYAARRPPP